MVRRFATPRIAIISDMTASETSSQNAGTLECPNDAHGERPQPLRRAEDGPYSHHARFHFPRKVFFSARMVNSTTEANMATSARAPRQVVVISTIDIFSPFSANAAAEPVGPRYRSRAYGLA